jgi:hypothetical protein
MRLSYHPYLSQTHEQAVASADRTRQIVNPYKSALLTLIAYPFYSPKDNYFASSYMESAGGYAASGGITGAIIISLYMAYKCCYRKKFHSECCGAKMDVKNDSPSPNGDAEISFENAKPTPRPSPALRPASVPKDIEIPPLQV